MNKKGIHLLLTYLHGLNPHLIIYAKYTSGPIMRITGHCEIIPYPRTEAWRFWNLSYPMCYPFGSIGSPFSLVYVFAIDLCFPPKRNTKLF